MQISYLILGILCSSLLLLTISWIVSYKTMVKLNVIKKSEELFPEIFFKHKLKELQHALYHEQFVLYYQPIVCSKTLQIVGAEALIRRLMPNHDLVMPDKFLPICERSGFIISLGEWIIQKACQQIKKWRALNKINLSIAVNLSARQLSDPRLLEIVHYALASSQIPPDSLKLEITESILMENVDSTRQLLQALRNLGVQLSLDDFGTGYSSLSYLKQFPFNILKIDKSFIADIHTNSISMNIVHAIITLGRNLNLTLIAEGIENNSQAELLQKMQCDLLQGYFYSKPLSEKMMTNLLTSQDSFQMNASTQVVI